MGLGIINKMDRYSRYISYIFISRLILRYIRNVLMRDEEESCLHTIHIGYQNKFYEIDFLDIKDKVVFSSHIYVQQVQSIQK